MSYSSVVLASGPTGYWKLNEVGGAATAVDSSGNGFDATLSAVPTEGVTGLVTVGTAMTFNGSTQAGLTGRQVFLPAKNGHISLEAWIKTVSGNLQMILCADNTGFTRYFQFRMETTGVISAVLFSGGVGTSFTFSSAVNDGAVRHLLFSYDGATGHLYNNAVEDGTGIAGVSKLESGGNGTFATAIAKRSDGGGDGFFFTGTIDEPAVYENVLTQADATAHYQAGIAAQIPTVDVLVPQPIRGLR